MNSEYGLMIIWEKARDKEIDIINDVKKHFEVINIFEVEWDKDLFSKNLSRFYGENLPKNSFKEKHCGTGKFLLLILKDNEPLYYYRKTSKGRKKVNINFFDAKELYRQWTGGGHKIHATNDEIEFKHDLMLLLGVNKNDYFKIYEKSDKYIEYTQNIIGSKGWESLEQVFYVLNETTKYVVLRNFQELPTKYVTGTHGDIDILCENYYNLKLILNSTEEFKDITRVRNIVNIDKKDVYFDLRYVGDNYYCKKWEENIISNRINYKCFYIPNDVDLKYSLLYHALVQKRKVAQDYLIYFENTFMTNDLNMLYNDLKIFMNDNNYSFSNATDISVYNNEKYSGIKTPITKKIYSTKFYIIIRTINSMRGKKK